MRRSGLARRPRRAVFPFVLIPFTALGLALTGCGAGAITQTASQASAVDGSSGQADSILIRDASIAFVSNGASGAVYQSGQAAPLNMTMVNTGDTTDRLVSVSSPVATSGQIVGDATLPAGSSIQVSNNAGGNSQALALRTIAIKLVGLTQPIRAGLTYPVVFRFGRAGELTVQLPVGYPTGPQAERN